MCMAIFEAFEELRKLHGYKDAPEMKPPAALPSYTNVNMELSLGAFDFEKENNADEIEDYLVILNEQNVNYHNNNTNNNNNNTNNNNNNTNNNNNNNNTNNNNAAYVYKIWL